MRQAMRSVRRTFRNLTVQAPMQNAAPQDLHPSELGQDTSETMNLLFLQGSSAALADRWLFIEARGWR